MGRKKKRRDETMYKMVFATAILNLITMLIELLKAIIER